jgi:signal peptide peptidase SppA
MDLNLLLAGKLRLLDPAAWAALNERMRLLGEVSPSALQPQAAGGARATSWQRAGGGVGIIPVVGPLGLDFWVSHLGGTNTDALCSALREARDDREIKSILLVFDSPGGVVDLIPETAELIRSIDAVKPVVAFIRPMAASAAYWLASQCRQIISTPSGQAGSIGSYILHVDQSRLLDGAGITPTYVFSSVSPFKVEGNSFEALSEEAQRHIQGEVDSIGHQFVAAVARGRRVSDATVRAKYGRGRMLYAQDALAAGMIDRIEPTTVDRLWSGRGATLTAMTAADRDAILIAISLAE